MSDNRGELLSRRRDCPRCDDQPITVRAARGESETTYCLSCGLTVEVANGGRDSIAAWNRMVDALAGSRQTVHTSGSPAGEERGSVG